MKLEQFRKHGAELDDDSKRRLVNLELELRLLTTKFGQNLVDAAGCFELLINDEDRLRGLPTWAKATAAEVARRHGGRAAFCLTLESSCSRTVLRSADDATIRRALWHGFNTQATEGKLDNRPIIRRILELRHEKARLLGYPSFADWVLHDRMAGRADVAMAFLDRLRELTAPQYAQEAADIAKSAKGLHPADVLYRSEQLRRAQFNFDEEELRAYFPLEQVLEGVFSIAHRLFGVTIEQREDMPVWHPSVRAYAVRDDDGSTRGFFYADLLPRPRKRDGAWVRCFQVNSPNGPHSAFLIANVTPPSRGRPSLLSHSEVQTLFHEFGHLLHFLLCRSDARALHSTEVAWDFVEFPSQFLANWCWEPEALSCFARHWQTGQSMPPTLLHQLARSRNFHVATDQMEQIGLATLDLVLHSAWDPETGWDPTNIALDIQRKFSAAPLPDDYALIARFVHLFKDPEGLAAAYYGYKWTEALEADAFSLFRERGVFDSNLGRRFRETILEPGNTDDAMSLFVSFMGRELRPESLSKRQGLL